MLWLLTAWLQPLRAFDELYSQPDVPAGLSSTWSSTDADVGGAFQTYESFSLASASQVNQVTWTGVYIDENPGASAPPTPTTTTWTIGFFTDAAGEPGGKVHSVDIPAANVTSVLVSNEVWHNGNPLARRRYTATLPAPVLLSAGVTYWFSPVSRQPAYNPHFSWWTATGAGNCFQHQANPPTDHVRPDNRAFTLLGGPPPPGISLSILGTTIASGGNYNIGTLATGLQHSAAVQINNTGGSPLTGISASITAGGSDFSIGISPPTSVAAGSMAVFTVVFSPQTIGARSGTLELTSNGDPSPYTIQFSGTGEDTTPPTINPQAGPLNLVDGAGGNEAALSAWLANHGGAVATDDSGSVTWTHDYAPPLPGPGESRTVTFTARDPSNNSVTTANQLRMLDQTPPTITSPAVDFTVNCSDPNRVALVNAWLASNGTATATDNSGSVTWSNNFTTLPVSCGAHSVDFEALDPSGNWSATSAVVYVVDNTPPVFTTPPSDLVVESNGTGNTTQRTEWLIDFGGSVATDSCSGVFMSHNFGGLGNNLPQTVPVNFTAVDACGNPTIATANFVIQDTTPPQLTTAAKDYYGSQATAASSIATFLSTRGGANAVDIAGPVTWTHNFNGTPPPVGGYATVTFTATDTVGLSVSTTCRLFLFPPGTVWVGPSSGFWSTGTNWFSSGSSTDYYVDLFSFQNTHSTMNGNYNLQGLHVGAGDRVDMDGSITLNGTIHNAGIIRTRREDDTIGFSNYLVVNGQSRLEGPGRFILGGAAKNQIVPGSVAPYELTVAPGHEITTSSDTYGGYQGTSIHTRLVNQGTLTADGGGLNLYDQPKVNQGVFRAINGGYLEIQTPVNNTGGTVSVGTGSTVILQQDLAGGTVTGTGKFQLVGNNSLTGPTLLDTPLTTSLDGGSTWLGGTITNNGLVKFGSDPGGEFSYILINGPVTLNGSGKMRLQGAGRRQILAWSNYATDILTVGAQQEITTDHRTGSDYQESSLHAGIVNQGTITANGGGLSLHDQPKTNNSTLRAINGGFLKLQANIDNTNGSIVAGPASTVFAQAAITGGTITGTGRVLVDGGANFIGPMQFDSGLTVALDSGFTGIAGTITHNGNLTLGHPSSGNTSNLYINGLASLTGNGKIILQGGGRRNILRGNSSPGGVALTVGPGIEITTDANTGLNYQAAAIHAAVINDGTITANGGGLTIYDETKTNNGTMRAINGGRMAFQSVNVTNYNAATDTLTGGNWEVESNGPVTWMDFESSPVVHLAAGTTVRLSGANASFAQLQSLQSIAGTLVLENGKTLATSGNLIVPGRLKFGLPAAQNTTRLDITGNADFSGGTVDIADLGMTGGSYILATWTGSVTGTPAFGARPPGMQQNLVVDPVAKQLRLEVVVIPPVTGVSFSIEPGTGPNAGQNVVTLTGTGYPGATYEVEASEDLVNWTPVSSVLVSPSGEINFTLLQSPGIPRRFFRFQPE